MAAETGTLGEVDNPTSTAQHAASNLNNRDVEILCAALAHVNVSVLYQFVDSAKQPWPTSVAPRRIFSFGRAARGSVAPRKMACRPAAGDRSGSRPSTRAKGAAWSLPLLIGSGNGRQDARPCSTGRKDCTKLPRTSDQRACPHADIYTARSPTNRAGGENATTPAGSRPVDRISWNPSARQGVLSIRHWAVRRKEKLLCQY